MRPPRSFPLVPTASARPADATIVHMDRGGGSANHTMNNEAILKAQQALDFLAEDLHEARAAVDHDQPEIDTILRSLVAAKETLDKLALAAANPS